jgi:nitrogen regulatory protein P-II 1
MKKIEAIIRTFALDEVRDALDQLDVTGMTVTDVRGYGSSGGHAAIYPGAEYVVDFVPRLKVEVVVGDDQVNAVLDALVNAAWSGEPGDGMVFVLPVDEAVRIRTRDRGLNALR